MIPALTLLVVVCSASPGDLVVARVDGTPIARAALVRRMESIRKQGRPVGPEAALEGLIVERLLAAEGIRMGLKGSPEVRAGVEAATRRAASEALFTRIAATVKTDEAVLRNVFHSTGDFASFELLVFDTKAAAQAALQRIDRGGSFAAEAPSATVAKLYSNEKAAPPLMRGQIDPSLATALFSAEPGRHVGPVELKTGWGVARLIRKEVGTEQAFAARRESLVGYAREQAAAAARKHFVEQLRAKAKVTIDEAFLRSLDGTSATPAQLDHTVAVVNGAAIRYRAIHASLRSIGGAGGHMGGPTVKIQLVAREVENHLLEDAAMEQGLGEAPEVVGRRPEFEQTALARGAAAAIEAKAPPPSEEEISSLYKRNSSRYDGPFERVLPSVVADAAALKRSQVLNAHVEGLRKNAAINVDRKMLKSTSGE